MCIFCPGLTTTPQYVVVATSVSPACCYRYQKLPLGSLGIGRGQSRCAYRCHALPIFRERGRRHTVIGCVRRPHYSILCAMPRLNEKSGHLPLVQAVDRCGKRAWVAHGGCGYVVGGFGACWRDRSRRKMARNSSLIPGCNCEERRRVEIHGSDVLSSVLCLWFDKPFDELRTQLTNRGSTSAS